jgi:hypothetical protein
MVHPYPCIWFIASTVVSVAEPCRITRLNRDAGDGVAYLLLPRLTLCPCFNAPFAGGLHRSARWDRSALVAPVPQSQIVKVIATTSAVRISASPVLLRLDSSLDGKPVR